MTVLTALADTSASTVILALIAGIPAILAAVGAVITSIRNGRKIDQLHVIVNSRLTQLIDAMAAKGLSEVELAAFRARTEGILQGAAEERERNGMLVLKKPVDIKGTIG